jgi:predicted alpha/beta hydrolase family esterase
LAASQNDPYCRTERAHEMAENWGSQWLNCGPFGHLNADSSLGDWPQGHALLQSLLKE